MRTSTTVEQKLGITCYLLHMVETTIIDLISNITVHALITFHAKLSIKIVKSSQPGLLIFTELLMEKASYFCFYIEDCSHGNLIAPRWLSTLFVSPMIFCYKSSLDKSGTRNTINSVSQPLWSQIKRKYTNCSTWLRHC